MNKYDTLYSAIETNFSAESGASAESLVHFMDRLRENSTWRKVLITELLESLQDQDFSWKSALWAEYCHVIQTDSENEAREFLVENVLGRLHAADS